MSKIKKSDLAVFIAVCLISVICVCLSFAGTHDPWDGTKWDVASPDIDQPHGNAYKELYDLRKGIAIRMNKEHVDLATSSAGGEHTPGGCAVLAYESTATIDTNTAGVLLTGAAIHDALAYDTTLLKFITFDATGENVVDLLIDTPGLSADCINETKLEDDSLDSEHYNDGSIDAVHLAADVIDETKIADDGIDSEHYNDGSIDTAHLAADVIDGTKIADDSVDSEHLAAGGIDTEHIGTTLGAHTNEDDDGNAMLSAHAYLANQDGVVNAVITASATGHFVTGYVDTDTNPASGGDVMGKAHCYAASATVTISFRVQSGKYFEVTASGGSLVIWWQPEGTLVKPTDQD